jgi:two-component system CheB/CheR fusion protein
VNEQFTTYQQLQDQLDRLTAELRETRYLLEEANDTIDAIRNGEIDALIMKAEDGHQLYTLRSSDQAYRIFVEQMTTGALTLNHEGLILFSNSRFATMLDLPLHKIIGKLFCNFVTTSERERCQSLIEGAWSAGCMQEFHLTTANGTQLPVLLSLQTLTLQDGLAMSVIITDLSAQKEQQRLLEDKNNALEQARLLADELNSNLEKIVRKRTAELYENQERLSRILETMAEGVSIIDTEGKLTYANPMAQKILGLIKSQTKEYIYNDPKWANLRIDGTPLPHNEHPMIVTMAKGEPVYDYEIAVQPPDDERFYVSINAAPIRDEQGAIIGCIGTFMDVTHRRRVIQQKDEFISVASHELKTPITSLKGALQLLNRMKDRHDPLIFTKFVEQANKSLNKVSVLVDDLLNGTKVTEGQLQLRRQVFNLQSLINECCPHVRAEGVYELVIQGDTSLQVDADPHKIDQVLVNLVNNAVKYAGDSHVILINTEKVNEFAKVSVTDYGPGIAPDQLPHLFERYYRGNGSSQLLSGLGLGLYICAEVIKKHGGQIGVETTIGKGSTFWFTVPLAK